MPYKAKNGVVSLPQNGNKKISEQTYILLSEDFFWPNQKSRIASPNWDFCLWVQIWSAQLTISGLKWPEWAIGAKKGAHAFFIGSHKSLLPGEAENVVQIDR